MSGITVDPKVAADPYVTGALDAILSASEGNGGSFTCYEAGEIAELFERAGRGEDAESFLEIHGDGDDDPEDVHVGYRYRALMFWDEGVTLDSVNVVVHSEHRRARGEGTIHGPYADGYEARAAVVHKYETGLFDEDGCEATFKVAQV